MSEDLVDMKIDLPDEVLDQLQKIKCNTEKYIKEICRPLSICV
jgi:hypothetical protein